MAAVRLSGFTADNVQYVRVRYGARTSTLPWSTFAASKQQLISSLAASGIVLVSKTDRASLTTQAEDLRDFPPLFAAMRPGWCGPHFVFPDGQTYSPDDVAPPEVMFDPDPQRCAEAGSMARWKTDVARPLGAHHIPAFVLMAALAPMILTLTGRPDNFSIELTGPPGSGKSTALQYAASAFGPIHGDRRYWLSFDSTRGGVESIIQNSADMPIIMDETNLSGAGGGPRAQARALHDFTFQVASGRGRSRLGQVSSSAVSTAALLSSNQSLQEMMMGDAGAVTHAATDRLRAIHVSASGIFDFLPTDVTSGGALAASIMQAARSNYGKAARKFAKQLVRARANDEVAIRNEIAGRLVCFRGLVGVSEDDGSACRVADIYGIIMVAGELAKRFHVLPSNFDCQAIAIACYQNSHTSAPLSTAAETILAVLNEPDVLEVDANNLISMTKEQLDRSVAFVYRPRNRRPQLLFWPYAFRHRFHRNYGQLLQDDAVSAMLMREGGRVVSKRRVRSNADSKDRFYCFELPHGRV